jgi:hypothetical protein
MVDFHTILITRAFLANGGIMDPTIMAIGDILTTPIIITHTSTIIETEDTATLIFIVKAPEIAGLQIVQMAEHVMAD